MAICCKTCDGKGGWVNDDSAPDFCGDSDIEKCYSCKGSGLLACDYAICCGNDAVRKIFDASGILAHTVCQDCYDNIMRET